MKAPEHAVLSFGVVYCAVQGGSILTFEFVEAMLNCDRLKTYCAFLPCCSLLCCTRWTQVLSRSTKYSGVPIETKAIGQNFRRMT